MSPSPTPAIVTGGTGWLGHALVRALTDQGRPLRVFDGDVRDPVALEKLFDGMAGGSVFHCAGVIHPERATREFFDVNVGGTSLVLDHARRARAARLTYVSSNSPFGYRRSPDEVFDEDAPYNPHLGYGLSKMEAERLVLRAGAQGELHAVVVRAPWFYGPGQPERQTRFFRAIRRGRFPLFGSGTNRRSLVYTDNLVDGLLLADASGAAGRAYWIADAESWTMAEVHASVRRALADAGLSTTTRQPRLPGFLCEIAARVDTAAQKAGHYIQPVHVLSEMDKTIACTIDRARRELGYEPKVDLDEGMRRSVQWCLDQGIEL